MSDSPTRDLVAELEAGGTFVDDGGFSLDEEAARKKLAEFRLADRAAWLCLIIEGATALGASFVRIESSRRELVIDFDGEAIDFRNVFGAAIGTTGGSDDRAARGRWTLALGLDVLFEDREELRLLGPRGQLELVPGEPPRFDPDETAARNFIRIQRRAVEVELSVVKRRCEFASIDVTIDDRQVSHGLAHALDAHGCGPERWPFPEGALDEGVRGWLGWHENAYRPSILLVLVEGVLTEQLDLPGLGDVVVVDGPLRKDLSHAKVLRNSRFAGLLADVDRFRSEHARPPSELPEAPAPRAPAPAPASEPERPQFGLEAPGVDTPKLIIGGALGTVGMITVLFGEFAGVLVVGLGLMLVLSALARPK